jgi:hypothetical protein
MVLASGCGSKTLVRIGGGNLKALLVFCCDGRRGLRHAARHHGGAARGHRRHRGRHAAAGPGPAVSLLALATGLAPAADWRCGVGGALGLALVGFALARPEGRSARGAAGRPGHRCVVVAVWWVSGRLGHLAEHPLTLEETFLATNSRSMESLSFVAPVAYTLDWLILFSDRARC